MEINTFKNLLAKKAASSDFDDYEIFIQTSKSSTVKVFKGNLEKCSSQITGGVGFRGKIGSKTGYAYSELATEDAVDFIINQAKENAKIMSADEEEEIFSGSASYPTVNVYNEELAAMTNKQKIDIALELERSAYKFSEKIELVQDCSVATGETEIFINNSKGLDLHEKSNSIIASLSVTASDGKSRKTGGKLFASHNPQELNIEKIVKKACTDAITALNAKSAKGYTGSVIFKNEVLTNILYAYIQVFFAELTQNGLSLLDNKEETKIASELITIVDNPLLEGGAGTTAFDCEGVASANKTIVENGILKTLLYNLKSAKKANTQSTGNGFKRSCKGVITTMPTNFYIKNGTTPYPDLVKKLNNGIIITDVSGLHAGANPISGDFSLLSSGYLVENGEITAPVEQITCAGNFFSLLNNITALSDDLELSSGGVGAPSAIVDDITISGE